MSAIDTETYRGILKCVCTPEEAFEPTGTVKDLLDWLMSHCAEINWCYNLSFDSDVLLRVFLEAVDVQHSLEDKVRFLDEHAVLLEGYRVTKIGAKSFSIERDKEKISFFDVSPFMTEGEVRVSLDTAAERILKEGKRGPGGLSGDALDEYRKNIGTVEGFYEENRLDIIEYCKRDADLTHRLGEYLADVAKEVLTVYPRRWSSAASLAKAWLELNHPEVMMRSKAHDKFFRPSFRGGIFVTRTLGRVRNVTEADITNAYGFAIRNLVSLEGLRWRSGAERHEDAVYGAYWILLPYDGRIPWRLADLGISISKKDKNRAGERVLYPKCERRETGVYCATKQELDYFTRAGIPWSLLWADEYCGTPVGLAFPDIAGLLKRSTDLKHEIKEALAAGDEERATRCTMLREIVKRTANSVYGSLAESRHGETPLTTWPLAAAITASCRCTIWPEWSAIEQWGGHVVSINTDSLRYVPGEYLVPDGGGALGTFEDKFKAHTVTHYQSGVALIEHPPACGCKEEPHAEHLLRADDGLGSPDPYPEETPQEARRRMQHPPKPFEENGLEIHASECKCHRCGKAPRVSLRRRGMPSLGPVDVLLATGPKIEVVSRRPIHAYEGVISDRMSEVADIPESEEDIALDDGRRRRELSVLSNIATAVYETSQLTYPILNDHAVVGAPIPFEALMANRWVRESIAERELVESALEAE